MTKEAVTAPGPVLWQPLNQPEHPTRLLFAAPHVGGGAAVARTLARDLGPTWACFGLGLPGRERRSAEQPDWTFAALVEEAAAALVEVAARIPEAEVVGVGQCSGAWLVHAVLAHAQHELGARLRLAVMVSQEAWHRPRQDAPLPDGSDELWERLVASGDTHPEVAQDEDARELLEPVLRADHEAVRGFPRTSKAVAAPLLVVLGTKDASMSVGGSDAWRAYGTSLSVATVPAGHLALTDNPSAVARQIEIHLELLSHQQG